MSNNFLNKENIFIQTSKFADLLIESDGYASFHDKIVENNLEYNEQKTYEIAQSGFVDFNQHLYEDINHMNSISAGIYLQMSLVTFRLFLWGAKGECFEIFRHVLIGDEIKNLNSIEEVKNYVYLHLNELEEGILKTYGKSAKESFEQLGLGLENRQLPLAGILQDLTIVNNLNDFR